MRLRAHLLVQLRVAVGVAVGVGVVLVGGCDLLDEAKGAIAGEADVEVAAAEAEAEPKAAKPKAAKPAEAASRSGLADKVAKTVDEVKDESLRQIPRAPEPEPRPDPEATPEPEPEPEDVTAFVPFGRSKPEPLSRIELRKEARRPIARAETPDDPCAAAEVGVVLGSSERPDRDPCPACGPG